MSLREFILNFLGRADGGRVGPGGARRPSDEERGLRDRQHFEERLRALTEERPGGGVVAGRLRTIALTHVKERLGEEWPRIASRVRVLASRVIERRLRPEDAYLQNDESTFLILFASLGEDAASFKAGAIAREITSFLLGELPPDTGEVETLFTVGEIDGAELAGGGIEELTAAVERRAAGAPAQTAGEGTEALPPAEEDLLAFEYVPVWCRAAKKALIYRGLTSDAEGDGKESALPLERRVRYERDCALLQTVIADIEAMLDSGTTALVVVPVSWRTLTQSGTWAGYLDICRAQPQRLLSLLGFEVIDMPAGTWQVSMLQHLSRLQPFARFVMVDVDPDPLTVGRFKGTGVRCLVLDAAPFELEDETQRWRLETFVRNAHSLRLGVCARDVTSGRAARQLLDVGVDLVGGPGVAAGVPLPGHPYDLSLEF